MKTSQLISDRLAMTLSIACIVHCLFVPTFLISSVALFSIKFSDEILHYSLLFMAALIATVDVSLDVIITRKIDLELVSDTPLGLANSASLGLRGFGDAFDSLNPDLVLCNLDENTNFHMEMTVGNGKGYVLSLIHI